MGLQLGRKVAAAVAAMVCSATMHAQQYTEKNTLWNPPSNGACFVILKHQKNCLKCFGEVFDAISKNFPQAKYEIASLSIVDSSVFARKMEATTIRELMPGASPILFEYRNTNGASLFEKYNPDFTPAIVVFKDGKETFIPYDSIYVDRKLNKRLKSVLTRGTK
jgi:hypothetical protein